MFVLIINDSSKAEPGYVTVFNGQYLQVNIASGFLEL